MLQRAAHRVPHRLLARHARHRHASTVAVGISGGVDSAVAAMLLKRQGHDVVGVHMSNWDSDEDGLGVGCNEQDREDAQRVCAHLGIGFHEVSFQREYWHEVFEPFLQGYREGGTPNPDMGCNRHIKFAHFTEHTRRLGAELVATGHYARLRRAADGRVQLLAGVDPGKDQSYALASVRQSALARTLFPLGELPKAQVRALAAEAGLHVAGKRDSTGICFVGRRNFGDFIDGYIEQSPGDFVCVERGEVLGRHRGLACYTPGQRARLGGRAQPLYIVRKEPATNSIVVCEGADHPALLCRELRAGPPTHWVAGEAPAALQGGAEGGVLRCEARVRYQQPLVRCEVRAADTSAASHGHGRVGRGGGAGGEATDDAVGAASVELLAKFAQPMPHVAEGQAFVLYDGEVCLGTADIVARGPSLYDERQMQMQQARQNQQHQRQQRQLSTHPSTTRGEAVIQ